MDTDEELFQEWHRRECPNIVSGWDAPCDETPGGDGDAKSRGRPWLNGGTASLQERTRRFAGRTCREVWAGEKGRGA